MELNLEAFFVGYRVVGRIVEVIYHLQVSFAVAREACLSANVLPWADHWIIITSSDLYCSFLNEYICAA